MTEKKEKKENVPWGSGDEGLVDSVINMENGKKRKIGDKKD